jgi:hypothetical protein
MKKMADGVNEERNGENAESFSSAWRKYHRHGEISEGEENGHVSAA